MMATAAAALLILAAASTTPPEALECPASAGDPLVYIDIYDGAPENQADLVPDQHQDKANKTAWNTWQLDQNPERIYVKSASVPVWKALTAAPSSLCCRRRRRPAGPTSKSARSQQI